MLIRGPLMVNDVHELIRPRRETVCNHGVREVLHHHLVERAFTRRMMPSSEGVEPNPTKPAQLLMSARFDVDACATPRLGSDDLDLAALLEVISLPLLPAKIVGRPIVTSSGTSSPTGAESPRA
jgi:hypothetical protein